MLDALTVVTNAVMHREGDRDLFFAVDVEGYRARRRATLRSIALRAAERALQDGVDVELEPMPASERRIVHMTLAAHRDLATESTGVGFDRRVVISARREPRDVDRAPRDVDRAPRDVDRAPRDVDRAPRDREPLRPRDREPDRGARDRKPIHDEFGPPVDDRYAD
jgi:spoIIIJ-associated protein